MKKLFQYFSQGSPMYIALHAQYRRSRGRRPVAISASIRDPRKALRAAKKELNGRGMMFIRLARPCKGETLREAMDKVGIRPLNQRELEFLLSEQQQVEWEQRRQKEMWSGSSGDKRR